MEIKSAEDYFTPNAWKLLSDYERKRYTNLQENFEMMKSTGIAAKMPEFMTCNYQNRKRNQASNRGPKELFQVPSLITRDQRAKVKLFGVTPVRKNKKRNIEEVGDSAVATSSSNERPTVDFEAKISFCNPSRKQFAQVALKSTFGVMKFLESILGKGKNISVKEKSVKVESKTKSRYPKRSIEKKSYKEDDISSDDDFLHCDDCEDVYKGACPQHGPMLLVCDTKVEKGDPESAVKSLPPFMSLGDSAIKKAGLGVWTEVPLPKGLLFGPYKGPKVPKNSKETGYAWQVWKGSRAHHLVEGADPSQSNWLRYVNCAQSEERQNMEALQFQGKVYYKIYKEVKPFCEMLVWYGDDYAKHLGIETIRRHKDTEVTQESKEVNGYACDVCGSLFSSSSAMEAHKKRHPNPDRRHKCTQCTYSTDRVDNLRQHLLTHTGERLHACPHCGKRFACKNHLNRHLRVHMGQKAFCCNVCDRAFNLSSTLRRHEMIHRDEKPYRCTTCGKDFAKAYNLKRHEMTHTLQRPFRCPQCNYRTTRSSYLREHIVRVHTREFSHKCSECGKGFTAHSDLKSHLLVHSGEKSFRCPHCNYKATRSDALRIHKERVHTRDFSHKCAECGKGFTSPSDLKRHLLVHSGEKPYSCPHCNYKATRSSHLREHIARVHTRDFSHKCSKCDQGFVTSRGLKGHLLVHTGEKPYRCYHCDFKTAWPSALRGHIVSVHTRDFRHKCSECDKGFIKPNELKKHVEMAHQKKQEN